MYHYEQNVQQHFYLLDTPVVDVRCISLTLSLKDLRIHGGRGKGEGEGEGGRGRGKGERGRGKGQGARVGRLERYLPAFLLIKPQPSPLFPIPCMALHETPTKRLQHFNATNRNIVRCSILHVANVWPPCCDLLWQLGVFVTKCDHFKREPTIHCMSQQGGHTGTTCLHPTEQFWVKLRWNVPIVCSGLKPGPMVDWLGWSHTKCSVYWTEFLNGRHM